MRPNHISHNAESLKKLSPIRSRLFASQTQFSQSNTFYSNQQITEDIQLATRLLENSTIPLLITGDQGSGKTSYLQMIAHALHSKNRYAYIPAKRRTTARQLLKQILQGLRIPRKLTRSDSMQLFEGLIELTRKQINAVILIDNAHLLPDKTLESLTDLVHDTGIPVTIGMAAIPTFTHRLSKIRPALIPGDSLHAITIRPFTVRQTSQFLNLYLQTEDITLPCVLTDVQLARLNKYANGLPGQIKQCIDNLVKPNTLFHQIYKLIKPAAYKCDPLNFEQSSQTDSPKISTMALVWSLIFLLTLIALTYYFSP